MKGSIVALITPMLGDQIDFQSFEKLLDFHERSGTHALAIGGTTGESPTLETDELIQLLKLASQTKLDIIVGCGGNNTKKVSELAKILEKNGAKSLLSVVPYYNKPPQEGLFKHFSMIAGSVSIPIILYNVPGRVVAKLELDTIESLTKNHQNIVGIKDCTGDFELLREMKRRTPDYFSIYQGEDDLVLCIAKGIATGAVNVIGNIFPEVWSQICTLCLDRKKEEASLLFQKVRAIIPMLFNPANPIPTKFLLHYMGLISEGIRLPLVWLPHQYRQALISQFEAIKDAL